MEKFWRTLFGIPQDEHALRMILNEREPLDELAAKHGGTVEPTVDGKWKLTIQRRHEDDLTPIIDDAMPIFNASREK